jgi:hypothetical protein
MQEKPDCEVCEHFADKRNDSTPCDECLPELMLENVDAWRIYSIISGQFIMGQAGPVDVNHLAIHRAMELYEIENKRVCFEQVCRIARHMLQKTWDKNKT